MKHLAIICCCAMLSLSCEQVNEAEPNDSSIPAFDITWNSQTPVVCFGTSLTYGYGAGGKVFDGIITIGGSNFHTGDSSYPRFLQEKLLIHVWNNGSVGLRLGQAHARLEDSVLSKRPALVLLELGANDFLQDIPARTSDSILSLIVIRMRQYGTAVVLVSFIHPEMLQFTNTFGWTTQDSLLALEYHAMFKEVSARFSVPLVEYPLKNVYGNRSRMSDRLHPNGVGYLQMEENIFGAMYATFERNRMLK